MQPSRASIVLTARECLAEILAVPIEEIPEHGILEQELDIDSLQQLELMAMLEERFDVILDADDLSQIDSLDQLADRALQRLKEPR